jgi:hypothetical protein
VEQEIESVDCAGLLLITVLIEKEAKEQNL